MRQFGGERACRASCACSTSARQPAPPALAANPPAPRSSSGKMSNVPDLQKHFQKTAGYVHMRGK